MKKAMSTFAALVMVAGLYGCGKENKTDTEEVEQPKESTAKNWAPETADQPEVSNANSDKPATPEQPKAAPKFQTQCPVDGGRPRRDCFADEGGLRVFLCSATCTQKFGKAPGKYIGEMAAQGVTVLKVQTTCPVTGNAIKKSAYADISGMRVYLCSAGCAGTLTRDPGKYLKKQMMEGVVYDMAPDGGHNHGPDGHAAH